VGAVFDFLRRHKGWLLLGTVVLLAVPLIAAAVYVASMIPRAPTEADIRNVRAQSPTVLMTADGKELVTFRRTNRESIKLADVSPHVLDALLATEDHRFFDHRGLDIRRTISAAWRTFHGDLQGGSTISQQLARNMFPEEIGRAPTIERKVKEAITALRLERMYGKEEILEMYLNTVPFLYNAYGIEMAARTYFDKSAHDLDVLESATLIGMLKGTRYYNPVLNPERAAQRRNTVLAQLVKHGKLDAAECDRLKKQPLALDFERQEEDLGPAPHLAQALKRWLIAWADKRGYNIYADGLVVRTTIDSRMQQMAVDALGAEADKLQAIADKVYAKPTRNRQLLDALVRETSQFRAEVEAGLPDAQALKKLEGNAEFLQALWKEKTHLQSAFLAQDPTNGHVKAWVGSRDFREDQFDHVQQARRQPGSTFKPFVYGAAFAMGMSPNELFIDQPVEIALSDKTVWKPADVSPPSNEPMTLRDGLVFSKNTITAQLVQRVGAERVAETAKAMGVRQSKLDLVPSLALGTSPVTLKEMVSAYSTIAASGRYIEPVLVLRIEKRGGEVIETFEPRAAEQAMPEAVANTLLDVMRGVVERGTGAGIRSRYGLQGDLAGKTGTTQDNTDGWFMLMHPNLVAGAWVGFNDARITMGDSWGQGGRNALLVVGNFFQQAGKGKLVDMKAKFTAPRDNTRPDPEAIERMKEWWASTMQAAQPEQQQQQPVVVYETHRAPPMISITPSEAPAVVGRSPDFTWTPQRQRSTEFQDSPGFSGGPPQRSSTAELGGPPPYRPPLEPVPREERWYPAPQPQAQAQPPTPGGETGIRILRSY
jgi:penicillin-binding protein 1A